MDSEPKLEERVFARLQAAKKTLATAESCSGGLIAHRMTNVAGVSALYLGGVVAYSNEVKIALLGVDARVIASQGAVCEEVARQMAEGVRKHISADVGIGVTGIAGPGGGSDEKPVGLVYIAVACGRETFVERNVFTGSRDAVKAQTADRALQMVLECVE